MKMTEKQRIFCREYILDWNATQAAIRAGYSEKTANIIGHENLAKPNIKKYIEEIQDNLAEVAGISQLMVLNEHKKIALSSIAHLHNTWIERKDFEDLTSDQKACISEIVTQIKQFESDERGVYEVEFVKIKLYDKQRALEAISKMLGYEAPKKIDHTSKGDKIEKQTPIILMIDGKETLL